MRSSAKGILAVAQVAIRGAVRTRLVCALLLLLAAAIAAIVFGAGGDGTIEGRTKVTLYYGIWTASVILGVSALWTACGSISGEIENREIRLVAVKPVARIWIWFGKWLGLVFLFSVLFCLSAAVLYGAVRWTVKRASGGAEVRTAGPDSVFTVRRVICPRPTAVDREAYSLLAQLAGKGVLSPGSSTEQVLTGIGHSVLLQKASATPGRSCRWTFDLPGPAAGGTSRDLALRLRFVQLSDASRPATVSLSARFSESSDPVLLERRTARWIGVQTLRLPESVSASSGPLTLIFANEEPEGGQPVVFQPATGAEILSRESSFESNLLRSVVIIICLLAALTALGLTCGALFSFPVAAFLSASLIVICLVGHGFTDESSTPRSCRHCSAHNESLEPGIYDGRIARTIGAWADPFVEVMPLWQLSNGILVSWHQAGRAFLLLGLAVPALMLAAGNVALNLRELAESP